MREEPRGRAAEFLQQAKEFLSSAMDSLEKGRPNAAGFDAVQSIINSNDALTVKFLGRRASKDHREAVNLHVDVIKVVHDDFGRAIIKEALDKRSAIGYMGKRMGAADARSMVDKAVRFAGWVEKMVSG